MEAGWDLGDAGTALQPGLCNELWQAVSLQACKNSLRIEHMHMYIHTYPANDGTACRREHQVMQCMQGSTGVEMNSLSSAHTLGNAP